MAKKILSVFTLVFALILLFASCSKVEFKLDFIVDEQVYSSINTNGKESIKIPNNPVKDGYI